MPSPPETPLANPLLTCPRRLHRRVGDASADDEEELWAEEELLLLGGPGTGHTRLTIPAPGAALPAAAPVAPSSSSSHGRGQHGADVTVEGSATEDDDDDDDDDGYYTGIRSFAIPASELPASLRQRNATEDVVTERDLGHAIPTVACAWVTFMVLSGLLVISVGLDFSNTELCTLLILDCVFFAVLAGLAVWSIFCECATSIVITARSPGRPDAGGGAPASSPPLGTVTVARTNHFGSYRRTVFVVRACDLLSVTCVTERAFGSNSLPVLATFASPAGRDAQPRIAKLGNGVHALEEREREMARWRAYFAELAYRAYYAYYGDDV